MRKADRRTKGRKPATESDFFRSSSLSVSFILPPFRLPVIIDLERFVSAERGYWDELETRLDTLEHHDSRRGGLDLAAAERLHYLYQRAAGDLARLDTFSAERDLRRTLGALVARAYAEIHSQGGRAQTL